MADAGQVSRLRVAYLVLTAALVASCSRLEAPDQGAASAAPGGLALELEPTDEVPTLRLALVKPESCDPTEISMADQGAVIYCDLVLDGLSEVTADGRLVPALATGWAPSEDGFAWTFALDAERTDAESVRASFERLRSDAPDSPAALLLANVVRIDVVDNATVRFVLSAPNAGFAWLVSGLPYSIAADGSATSGRFAVTEDDTDHTRLLDDRRDQPAAVLITWVDDEAAAEALAFSGEVDGAVVSVGDAASAAREVGRAATARSIVRFYELDPTSAALADLRVRQAVLAAIDKRALIDVLGSSAFPADGLAAPTSAGFGGGACAVSSSHDLDRAAALIADIGETPTIRIGYSSGNERTLGQGIVDQLAAVGLRSELVEIGVGQVSAALAAKTVDMIPYGWVAPAGSIDVVLPPLLSGTSAANPLGVISAEVDQTLATAAATNDDAERWALLEAAHRTALDQAVFLPVAAAESRFVVSPAFTGVLSRADGSIEIRTLP